MNISNADYSDIGVNNSKGWYMSENANLNPRLITVIENFRERLKNFPTYRKNFFGRLFFVPAKHKALVESLQSELKNISEDISLSYEQRLSLFVIKINGFKNILEREGSQRCLSKLFDFFKEQKIHLVKKYPINEAHIYCIVIPNIINDAKSFIENERKRLLSKVTHS